MDKKNHKYISKYKSKSGKWVYVYKPKKTIDAELGTPEWDEQFEKEYAETKAEIDKTFEEFESKNNNKKQNKSNKDFDEMLEKSKRRARMAFDAVRAFTGLIGASGAFYDSLYAYTQIGKDWFTRIFS